jgi:putative lipoic acid-binding regulatory protein
MKPITSRITIEVMGSPKEHVEKALVDVINKLKNDKQIEVVNVKAYKAEQQENKLWSTFADIEIETKNLKKLSDICYDYMPSTLEILEPIGMEMQSIEVQDFINDVLTRMHKYAMVIRKLQTENIYMMKELEKVQGKKPKVIQ